MEFARNLSENYAIAVGMISKEEVLYNVKYFNGDEDLEGIISIRNKKQIRVLQHQCVSCGHVLKLVTVVLLDMLKMESLSLINLNVYNVVIVLLLVQVLQLEFFNLKNEGARVKYAGFCSSKRQN